MSKEFVVPALYLLNETQALLGASFELNSKTEKGNNNQ